jgi:hypothetical protein
VTVLSLPELGELINERHTFDLLRVQTLDRYDVASDGDDFRRYLAGEAEPTASRKQTWLDHLRALVDSGRAWRNVHVLRIPLSDYLRYACEWGYAYNVQAGQDVRIVELAAADLLPDLATVGDFWVIDQETVVQMRYDVGGRFIGAELVSDERDSALFRAVAGLLWRQAEPFTTWWTSHPQFHRTNGAA